MPEEQYNFEGIEKKGKPQYRFTGIPRTDKGTEQTAESPGIVEAVSERMQPQPESALYTQIPTPFGKLNLQQAVEAFGVLESALASILPTKSGEKVGEEETTAEAIQRGKTMGDVLTPEQREELGYIMSGASPYGAPDPRQAYEIGGITASFAGDPFNLILPLSGVIKLVKAGKIAKATEELGNISKTVKELENIDDVVKTLGKTDEESLLKTILTDIKEGKAPEQIIEETAKKNIRVEALPDVKGKRTEFTGDLTSEKVNPYALPEFGGKKVRQKAPIQKGQEPLGEVPEAQNLVSKVKAGKASGEEIKDFVKGNGKQVVEDTEQTLRQEFKAAKTPEEKVTISQGIDILTQEAGKKPKVPKETITIRHYSTKGYRPEGDKPTSFFRTDKPIAGGETKEGIPIETAKTLEKEAVDIVETEVPANKIYQAGSGKNKELDKLIENSPDFQNDTRFSKSQWAENDKKIAKTLEDEGYLGFQYPKGSQRQNEVVILDRRTLPKPSVKSPTPKRGAPSGAQKAETPAQTFRQFVESKGVKWEQVSGKGKDEALYQKLFGEYNQVKAVSGKEYAKGLVSAVKKDITSKASGITPDPYRHIKQFMKENKLELTDDELKTLNDFARKTLRGSGTAAEKQSAIERFAQHQIEARARMKAPPPTEKEVNRVVKETVKPEAEEAVTETQKILSEREARHEELRKTLEEAKPLRGEQERIYSKERAQKFAKFREKGKKTSGEKGFYEQRAQMAGEHTKVEFESLRDQLSQDKIDALFNDLKHSGLNSGDQLTAGRGLAKIFGELGGQVPTNKEIELLEEVFGKDLTKALLDKRSLFQKYKDLGLEIANVPRSLMASFDLSAPFRQGIFAAARHPVLFAKNFKGMFKSFAKEKHYHALLDEIHARPTYKMMQKNKLAITELGRMSVREERFMSNLAERIPLAGRVVRASGRAYTGFLDKFRADLFDYMVDYGRKFDMLDDPSYLKDAAKFINAATGRGTLGAFERAAVPLNTFFFSPRLMASRIQLLWPSYYVKLNPVVRKEALKSLFAFAGMGLTVAGVGAAAGADVETDPRNANFMKLKFGNTRYDILGGFQQPIRAAAQIISGKVISSTTGKEIKLQEGYKALSQFDIAQRFLEMKESPVASLATGILRGKNAIGEKFDLPTEVMNRFIPMVAQDMSDIYREKGPIGIPMAVPAIFGLGSQTYGGLQIWGLNNKDYPALNKELSRLKTSAGFPSTSAFGVELNMSEYKKFKREAGKEIAKELTRFIKTDAYKGSGDERKKEMIADRIDYIKEQVRAKLFSHKEREKYYEERAKSTIRSK